MNFQTLVQSEFRLSLEAKARLVEDPVYATGLASVCEIVVGAYRAGHKTLIAGNSGGAADACDHVLRAPSDSTPRLQECHILMGHTLCGAVEAALFERPPKEAR